MQVSTVLADNSLVDRLLYIDDDALACKSLTALLQTMGYRVDSADDPRVGLELFRSGRYSLVITDMNMPGMDGLGLTREVKQIAPQTPVIVISGSIVACTGDDAVSNRPDCVLQKPFAYEEFSRELLRLLEKPPSGGCSSAAEKT